MSDHHVIVVPGLGNSVLQHVWATNSWRKYGIIPHVFDAKWGNEEPRFRSNKQSVLMAEKAQRSLSASDRKKILTVRPLFDEVVPPSTVPILGARNDVVPSVEHVVSIVLAMTLFRRIIIEFIRR